MAFPAKIEKALRNFSRCFFPSIFFPFSGSKMRRKASKRTIKWSFKRFFEYLGDYNGYCRTQIDYLFDENRSRY